MLQTPVVLILFNRPALTAQVFARIRQLQPRQLFLIADGPRPTHFDDQTRCALARQVVAEIDWPCCVQRDYSETNLGCGRRVVSGLDWVFAQVDRAIILEDDILPDASFFHFCEELLACYRADERIAYISGFNRLGAWTQSQASYFACRHGNISGWATWQRAWQHYDFTLARFRNLDIAAILARHLPDPEHAARQLWFFNEYGGRAIDAWDMHWTLICMLLGAFCLMPSHNLVRNLGFHADATHTIDPLDMFSDLPSFALARPLVHPAPAQLSMPDGQFDRWAFFLALMNGYKDTRTLRLWQRLLDKAPGLTLPGLDPGLIHALAPLRHPAEALQILTHCQPYFGANQRLQRLIREFSALVA